MAETVETELTDDTVAWKAFIESCPEAEWKTVSGAVDYRYAVSSDPVEFHCRTCDGFRLFEPTSTPQLGIPGGQVFLNYVCRNCQRDRRTIATWFDTGTEFSDVRTVLKIGQYPVDNGPLPSKLLTLVRPVRDLFLKGLRAEYQGLGIGAYAYYRRIVEDQSKELYAEILKVARREGAGEDTLKQIERAISEYQYHKGVDLVKDLIPGSLLISGQNPMTLLHGAASHGVHNASDEDCLRWARNIRLVLTEFADKVAVALKDVREIEEAVREINKMRNPQQSGPSDRDR